MNQRMGLVSSRQWKLAGHRMLLRFFTPQSGLFQWLLQRGNKARAVNCGAKRNGERSLFEGNAGLEAPFLGSIWSGNIMNVDNCRKKLLRGNRKYRAKKVFVRKTGILRVYGLVLRSVTLKLFDINGENTKIKSAFGAIFCRHDAL